MLGETKQKLYFICPCLNVIFCYIKGKFYVKDVNSFDSDKEDSESTKGVEKFSLKDLKEEDLQATIENLLELDKQFKLSEPLEMLAYEDDFITKKQTEYTGSNSHKHLRQISSIVSHIKKLGLTKSEDDDKNCTTYIEMGAGRGKLSHWLSLSLNNAFANFLMIERGSQRQKVENLHKHPEINVGKFSRIRMDIKNLFLSELDLVKSCQNCVIFGKHLCGAATDFTLRCLKRTLNENDTKEKFKGLLLALCCHHRCDWPTFCGKKFFEELNLNSETFYRIRNLSSWATCGQRPLNSNEELDDDDSDKEQTDAPDEILAKSEQQLFKEKIGRICKNLIDLARIKYVESLMANEEPLYNAQLFFYCNEGVTLENRMLLIKPNFR